MEYYDQVFFMEPECFTQNYGYLPRMKLLLKKEMWFEEMLEKHTTFYDRNVDTR